MEEEKKGFVQNPEVPHVSIKFLANHIINITKQIEQRSDDKFLIPNDFIDDIPDKLWRRAIEAESVPDDFQIIKNTPELPGFWKVLNYAEGHKLTRGQIRSAYLYILRNGKIVDKNDSSKILAPEVPEEKIKAFQEWIGKRKDNNYLEGNIPRLIIDHNAINEQPINYNTIDFKMLPDDQETNYEGLSDNDFVGCYNMLTVSEANAFFTEAIRRSLTASDHDPVAGFCGDDPASKFKKMAMDKYYELLEIQLGKFEMQPNMTLNDYNQGSYTEKADNFSFTIKHFTQPHVNKVASFLINISLTFGNDEKLAEFYRKCPVKSFCDQVRAKYSELFAVKKAEDEAIRAEDDKNVREARQKYLLSRQAQKASHALQPPMDLTHSRDPDEKKQL